MGKLKRAITILIMMLLIIGIFIGRVNAASASISASARKVTVGQNVSVTVSFSEKVSAAQFKLSYDSSKFKFISSSAGNFGEGTQKFAYYSSDGKTPELSSVTLNFQSKTAGSSNFNLNSLKISTATQNKITPSGGGSVSIKSENKQDPKPDTKPEQKPSSDTKTNSSNGTSTSTSKSGGTTSTSTSKNTKKQKDVNNTVKDEKNDKDSK